MLAVVTPLTAAAEREPPVRVAPLMVPSAETFPALSTENTEEEAIWRSINLDVAMELVSVTSSLMPVNSVVAPSPSSQVEVILKAWRSVAIVP